MRRLQDRFFIKRFGAHFDLPECDWAEGVGRSKLRFGFLLKEKLRCEPSSDPVSYPAALPVLRKSLSRSTTAGCPDSPCGCNPVASVRITPGLVEIGASH